MKVCVMSDISGLFPAIVRRCKDLVGVHFTQLDVGGAGESSECTNAKETCIILTAYPLPCMHQPFPPSYSRLRSLCRNQHGLLSTCLLCPVSDGSTAHGQVPSLATLLHVLVCPISAVLAIISCDFSVHLEFSQYNTISPM